MKIGDLVKTSCFGPRYSRGEVGVLVKPYGRVPRCWVVLFGNVEEVVAVDGLDLINTA